MSQRLVSFLRGWLAGGTKDEPAPRARIYALLAQLETREHELEEALARERRMAKRRRLHAALEVVRLQRRKGIARRQELGIDGT